MFFRRRATKYLLFLLALLVVYNEFLVYRLQWWWWRRLDCETEGGGCTRLLLVADPQLQGDLAVPPPLSYLFNWDSDRYVKQTFTRAMNFFKPDIVIYLGDLMDEGSISTKEQFHGYLKRLAHVFDTDQPIMQVWIPGDNDIGGENEHISNEKIREFAEAFQQPDVLVFLNNIVVYKVNRITHTMPKLPPDHLVDEDNFNIIVSHYPLMGTGIFARKAIDDLHPDLILSGHQHIAKYVESSKDSLYNKISRLYYATPGDAVIEINFNNSLNYEILVPTCSYRMGVPDMGYGAAVLDHNNKRLRYDVLWSSRRFPKLILYLCALLLMTGYFAFRCVRNKNMHRCLKSLV